MLVLKQKKIPKRKNYLLLNLTKVLKKKKNKKELRKFQRMNQFQRMNPLLEKVKMELNGIFQNIKIYGVNYQKVLKMNLN